MSRINVGIPPKNLIDEHLLAEHREIKRICSHFEKRLKKNKFDDIPEKFTLGIGHLNFFLDKGNYTFERYCKLHNECERRGFNVTWFHGNWKIYIDDMIERGSEKFYQNYTPTTIDVSIIRERIEDRIKTMKKEPHFHGLKISREEAIKLLYK